MFSITEKILFINPNYEYSFSKQEDLPIFNRIWPPLSIANCAALLKEEGFHVEIIDANAEGLSPDQVAKRIHDSNKIFITSSSIDRWQCPHLSINPFLEFVKKIRENRDKELYVMGAHGTVRPKEILKITKADAVIMGEPELTVLEICKGNKTEGICYEEDGKITIKERKIPLDLNTLTIPAFHLLPMKRYFYEILGRDFTLLEGSRGCPFNCIFCLKKMYGKFRTKSSQNLIREIEFVINEFGIKNVYFMDLEFTTNKKLVNDVCDFLIQENFDFNWTCQTRLDSIDLKLLQKMKRAGCRIIHFGVESGSPRILEKINKKIDLRKIKRGVKLTRMSGIDTACFFLFGFPGETINDMEKTIEFATKLNSTYASFHVAVPYPGTHFFEMVKDNLSELFPIAYTQSYSFSTLKNMTKKAFFQFYFRPSFILSRLLSKNIKLLPKELKLFLSYVMREKI